MVLEEALPILTRLQKEGKWDELSGLIGVDNRLAEYNFRDDVKGADGVPEAIKLIRTLALFRSSEFETAGKALTKVENKGNDKYIKEKTGEAGKRIREDNIITAKR